MTKQFIKSDFKLFINDYKPIIKDFNPIIQFEELNFNLIEEQEASNMFMDNYTNACKTKFKISLMRVSDSCALKLSEFIKSLNDLKSATICDINISNKSMCLLLNSFSKCEKLQKIKIDSEFLQEDNFTCIWQIIKNCNLTHLTISKKYNQPCYEILFSVLRTDKSITHLNLSNNCINDLAISQLLNVLKYNKCIKYLDLSFNCITHVSTFAICNFILESTSLRCINLNNNRIVTDTNFCDRVMQVIATKNVFSTIPASLKNCNIRSIIPVLKKNCLESIEIFFDSQNISELGNAIIDSTIQKITVCGGENIQATDLMDQIVELINRSNTVTDLTINKGIFFNDFQTAKILSAVEKNKYIESFTMYINNLSENTILAICNVLKKNITIKKFVIIQESDLITLSIRSCALLLTVLKNNKSLLHIQINSIKSSKYVCGPLKSQILINLLNSCKLEYYNLFFLPCDYNVMYVNTINNIMRNNRINRKLNTIVKTEHDSITSDMQT